MENSVFNVIGIGELLWDILPEGKELGGAPANFVYHTKYFGAKSFIISAIGNDNLGEEIIAVLNKRNINCSVNKVNYPTGTVSVALKSGIPSYIIHENVAWDFIKLQKEAIPIIENADAICFGTLSQRSITSLKTIKKVLSLVPEHALKVFDINLRALYYSKEIIESSLKAANVLKLNDEELIVLTKMFNLKGNQEECCKQLLNKYNLKYLALTNGSKGSLIFHKDKISKLAVPKIKVIDTIGAGDSFTAAMVMGILNKNTLIKIHKDAVMHAAKVCANKGATPTNI
ncbi:carbohydrate kinase [Lutibacter sp.]|uniref:carbohydrate kinase family protein n=1 Tax=Lutibacter sp. TaxID=1925666 RepID=UPI0025BF33C7|nr:carbohydrate kinase [Lutibacter sp.]MCF6180909.1 carbohydrate kinase [Lutibacter sp.]